MKIGILGAGQLGRMLALAGYPLDLDFVFLDPATEACAAPLGEHIHADYVDEHALAEFCVGVDLATYEFENVPAKNAEFEIGRASCRVKGCQDVEMSVVAVSFKKKFRNI